jgi:hypothetical protein
LVLIGLSLAGMLFAPLAAAQEQSKPHSHVTLRDATSFSNGTASFNVELELGFLQCQSDFQANVDLQVVAEPGSPRGTTVTAPTSVAIAFTAKTFGLSYPYNYGDQTRVNVAVSLAPSPSSEQVVQLNVTASYAGGDVSGCTSTGPMPPAQAQITVPLKVPVGNATGSRSSSSTPPLSGAATGPPAKGAPMPGILSLAPLLAAAALVARRRSSFHRKKG